jgi:hypothetical protein
MTLTLTHRHRHRHKLDIDIDTHIDTDACIEDVPHTWPIAYAVCYMLYRHRLHFSRLQFFRL